MTPIPMMLLRTKVGELVNRALLRDEEFTLERKGQPVAVLVSVERYARLRTAERELAALRAPEGARRKETTP